MDNANNSQQTESRAVRRSRLVNMGVAYSLGTFNDNFFKQAALLLAAAAALISVQGMATMLFALPFVAFSAWTGWLADRLPKKQIVAWSKALEIVAMGIGFWALYTMSWSLIVFVVFFMGLQSTFFSPAMNGSIPENFDNDDVPRVNALLKLATTATILLGIALAGPFLDFPKPDALAAIAPEGAYAFGRLAVGAFAILVSCVGLLAAMRIKSRPTFTASRAPFPFLGPIHSVKHAAECYRRDRPLFLALSGEAFFYFFSSFVILCITNLGKTQLGLSMTVTSLLSVALMAGVCIGSLLAGRWPVSGWYRHVVPACIGMGISLLAASLCPFFPLAVRLPLLFGLFVAAGTCGGLYLIPIVSCIQVRPAADAKGKTLGISNFGCFSGIMISGPLFSFLLEPALQITWNGQDLLNLQFASLHGLTPAMLMGGAGLVGLLFALIIRGGLKRSSLEAGDEAATLKSANLGRVGRFLRLVLSLRYQVTPVGLENIRLPEKAERPILFLPNHPALVDPLIVYSLIAGAHPRPLADEGRMSGLWGRLAEKLLQVITIPDLSRHTGFEAGRKLQEGLNRVSSALRQGDSVLLYPSGRIYRSDKEVLGGNSGLARILEEAPDARLVLVRSSGLWGSSFSFAGARGNPNLTRSLLRGLLTLLGNLIFFTPRRKVEVEFVELKKLPTQDDKRSLNVWLENFYNEKSRPAQGVPRFFWQGSKPYDLPAYDEHALAKQNLPQIGEIAPETREKVYAVLREAARLDADAPINDAMLLNADLDLDSLAMMEVVLGLEEALGVTIDEPESLASVGDCLKAVSGLLHGAAQESRPAPEAWFAKASAEKIDLEVTDNNIAEVFLGLARKAPREIVAADRGGARTRRALLTGALVLAGRIRALPGKRVGLMLPAAPAALGVWLAAMLAGKETVFLNWTVGESNLRHCLKISEVEHVLTSSVLLDRLERQGFRPEALPVEWIRLEELAGKLTLAEKLRGAMKALFVRSFKGLPISNIAAILFTSGSETMPKGVPLSHSNLLTNASDAIRVLELGPDEKIVAMLPPFHSFGLLADMVLPLAFGLRAAFHANPTESAKVSELIRDFRLTLLPATPTFLEAIIERSKSMVGKKEATGNNLSSLRFGFVGAEKCPEHVYRAFAEFCPQASLCEGYGITECSPVVSVNRPGDAVPGTIGQALPSVRAVVVLENDGRITGPAAADETGMLLVRGPSIFSGYLGANLPGSDIPSPFVDYDGHSWYRTGDLVSMSADGRITFRGRLKRFVKIGGEMISLPQIENILLAAFGGRADAPQEGPALAVEAGSEENGAEITLFTPLPLSLSEVNAALRKAGLSAISNVRRIVKVDSIPLLGTGKTDYRSLKSQLA